MKKSTKTQRKIIRNPYKKGKTQYTPLRIKSEPQRISPSPQQTAPKQRAQPPTTITMTFNLPPWMSTTTWWNLTDADRAAYLAHAASAAGSPVGSPNNNAGSPQGNYGHIQAQQMLYSPRVLALQPQAPTQAPILGGPIPRHHQALFGGGANQGHVAQAPVLAGAPQGHAVQVQQVAGQLMAPAPPVAPPPAIAPPAAAVAPIAAAAAPAAAPAAGALAPAPAPAAAVAAAPTKQARGHRVHLQPFHRVYNEATQMNYHLCDCPIILAQTVNARAQVFFRIADCVNENTDYPNLAVAMAITILGAREEECAETRRRTIAKYYLNHEHDEPPFHDNLERLVPPGFRIIRYTNNIHLRDILNPINRHVGTHTIDHDNQQCCIFHFPLIVEFAVNAHPMEVADTPRLVTKTLLCVVNHRQNVFIPFDDREPEWSLKAHEENNTACIGRWFNPGALILNLANLPRTLFSKEAHHKLAAKLFPLRNTNQPNHNHGRQNLRILAVHVVTPKIDEDPDDSSSKQPANPNTGQKRKSA